MARPHPLSTKELLSIKFWEWFLGSTILKICLSALRRWSTTLLWPSSFRAVFCKTKILKNYHRICFPQNLSPNSFLRLCVEIVDWVVWWNVCTTLRQKLFDELLTPFCFEPYLFDMSTKVIYGYHKVLNITIRMV